MKSHELGPKNLSNPTPTPIMITDEVVRYENPWDYNPEIVINNPLISLLSRLSQTDKT